MNSDGTKLWGETIRYKNYHVSDEDLNVMRQKVDTLADDCLLALQEKEITVDTFISELAGTPPSSYDDRRMDAFAKSVLSVPDWVDWERVKHGQFVFLKNIASAALGLLYVSLVGGFAGPKITKVLDATAYMTKHEESTFRRLNETFEMVLDCVENEDSLLVGGRGFKSVLKVRFLHSRVRLNLLRKSRRPSNNPHGKDFTGEIGSCPFNLGFQASSEIIETVETPPDALDCGTFLNSGDPNYLSDADWIAVNRTPSIDAQSSISKDLSKVADASETKPPVSKSESAKSSWDSEQYGMPINQEDMMVTLLSFSMSILETIEKVAVKGTLSSADEDAYIHLWRYIGYLIGVNEDINPCTDKNRAGGLLESAIRHLLQPDKRSGELARHLLRSVAGRSPTYFSYETHSELARYLLGHEIANALCLERNFIERIRVFFIMKLHLFISYYHTPSTTRGSDRINRIKKILRTVVTTALQPKKSEIKDKKTDIVIPRPISLFVRNSFIAAIFIIPFTLSLIFPQHRPFL